MAGVGKVGADRQCNSVCPDGQGLTSGARCKRHFFPGMQMLFAVDPKRTIGPQHQCTDQDRRVIRQSNRHTDNSRHTDCPGDVSQRLQNGGIRHNRQLGREPAFVAGQRQFWEHQQLHALLRGCHDEALVPGDIAGKVSGDGNRLGCGDGQR
ncbi:hypothetical protein D9M72_573840 [compost metagenome]